MPGWARFNPDDIEDYCPGTYSISDGNIEFSVSIISLYLLLGVFLPSKYIEIGAPPHYLIIGGHSHGIQPAFPASLLTIAVFLIMIAAPLYTQIRLPALRIMKPEEQNLSDNVAHD